MLALPFSSYFLFFSQGVRQEHLGDEAPSVPLKNETTQQSSRPSGFDLDAGKHTHTHIHTFDHAITEVVQQPEGTQLNRGKRRRSKCVSVYVCMDVCISGPVTAEG